MKSIVYGAGGQDGSYLCELLLEKGHDVVAIVRRSSTNNLKWIEDLDIEIIHGDITDSLFVNKIMNDEQFDFCFITAAMSHVGISFDIPQYTIQVNTIGVLNVLEAVRQNSPKTRVLQCSTSEMLANKGFSNEETPFEVHSPYAVSKLAAHHLCKIYRDAYGLFVCCSICYNHESERRSDNFVTQKIVKALVNRHDIELGNINAYRDWGYSKEYCECMIKMLEHDIPDDYVIATGESHSVFEFIEECCKQLGLTVSREDPYLFIDDKCDLMDYIIIEIADSQKRPWDVNYLRGDATKAREVLGWEPKIKMKELIEIMIREEMKRNE